MDNSLESQIISTAQHLNAFITTYVLVENPSVDAYYSGLDNRLEKLARIMASERNKKNDRNRKTDCK